MRCFLLLLLLTLPPIALAEELPVTRAEGFRMIWEPLQRPIEETAEPPFADVPEDHPQGALLTYAKSRGIFDDAAYFAPDDPLRLKDALLWLLRSRNVDGPPAIQEDNLPSFLSQYPLRIGKSDLRENAAITREELTALMARLDDILRSARHTVSYYGRAFEGRTTAFGERFNPHAMTAAHRTLPHNTLIRVTNEENGRSVVVRINDRGPYVAGRDMDLSRAAFRRISDLGSGVLRGVTFERLGDYATLRSNERHFRYPQRHRRDYHR